MSGLKNVKYKLIASVCAALLATNMTPVYAASQDAAPAAETMSETDTPSPVKNDTDVSADPAASTAQSAVTASVTSNGQTYNLVLDGTLGNESSDEILGESWYYGVVADTFTFNGESETNFAVKNFEHANGQGGQTGVTDKGAGSKVDWITAGHVDASFMVKGISAEITVPEGEKDLFSNSTDTDSEGNKGTLTFHNLSADKINEYVTDLRNDASEQAQRLGGMSSAEDYSDLPQNQMTIDITPAGTRTVYLNVDAWDGLKNMLQQSSGVTIVKNPGQKIVFAYPQSEDVTTQKIVIRQNGQQYDTTGLANVSTQTTDIAPDIIYAMPAATSVTLNDTTGIIFAPNATVNCYGVDAGWINCQHFINDCEWHFINGSLPEQMTLGAKRPHPKKYENTETPIMPAKSNKTVEWSETPEEPETSKQPSSKASEKPKTTAQPKVTTTPKATVTPTETAQPKATTTPKATVTPTEMAQPKITTTPKATTTPQEKSEAPKTTAQPKVTTIPETPEATETPTTPETTVIPKKPEVPEITESPEKPEESTETDTPEKPEIPTETIVPTKPEQSTNLQESETTEELTKADKPTETDASTEVSAQSTQSTVSTASQVQGSTQMLTSAQPQAATAVTSYSNDSATAPQAETAVATDTVKVSDSPQTGDSSHLRIDTLFMMGSLAALFGIVAFRRKRKHS